MAQAIKQGDIFGRIGTGFGRGLAEQIPKEIDRNRLSSGLSAFEQDHQNLNPMQQLARLSAIPGVTPQTIQSFSELAKTNNQANAYRNLGGYSNRPGQGQPNTPGAYQPRNQQEADWLSSMGMGQNPQNTSQQLTGQQGTQLAPQGRQPSFGRQALENVNENTFNPAAKTRLPWTTERRDASIVDYIDEGFLPEQAKQMSADDEARDLGQATVLQQRQREDQERTVAANNELDRQLETNFQKTGAGVYKDITGEMKLNLQRAMNKALRTHPDLSIEEAAEEFSNRALSTSKAKGKFETLAQTTGIEALGKGKEINSKLDDYSDIFKKSGNSEEYYNMLKRSPDSDQGAGFGLSSEGAASIAFPPSPSLNDYVKNYKPQNMKQTKYGEVPDPKRTEANSRKAANDVARMLGENDSVLTIGRELRKKDPYFDQEAFYNEMKLIKDEAGLSKRQINELPERNTDWLPKWADFLILPWGNTR